MPPINGARAWLGIGSMGIQPAEFAKISTALLLSKYISALNIKQLNSKNIFLALLILLVPMVLILLQPDAGTFVVFTAFFFVLYREGLTFDPFLLNFVNLIPKVRFKQTWLGTHFIPILFVFVFLSIITLLFGEKNIPIIPGVKLYGSFGNYYQSISSCWNLKFFCATLWVEESPFKSTIDNHLMLYIRKWHIFNC